MGMMMAVSFERYGRLYYLDPGECSPAIGAKVLVPTDSGPEVATCVWAPQWVPEDIGDLPVCAGLADEQDLARDEENRRRRAQARLATQRLIRQHSLPMKLTAVDYLSGENKFVVYFAAPERVDFRTLVRDLSARMRARVELRQIGPRDEARLQGGIGPCGRDLCCATFLKDFEPVSVRMAKDQDLPVNPMRIAGACGRLMCCLKYEHPLYQEFRKDTPPAGAAVDTPAGPGTVVGHNVPSDTVVVKLAADGRATVCSRASVCGSRHAYEAMHGKRLAKEGSAHVKSPRAITTAAIVAGASLIGGCSSSAASPAPATLAGYYAQHLDWQSCNQGFQCATLLVPRDYRRPGWERFSLPVIKLPASDPGRRIGSLVLNPGGPGGSGVQYALGAHTILPAAILARFDIVGFDPRGVGGSEPAVHCLTGPQLDQYFEVDGAPADAAQLNAIVTASREFAAGCERESRDLLPYVGTENAARDMDVLRAALGDAKLNYLGKSYGTYLGAWYAQLFPGRVRALVLDGAVDPDTPALEEDIVQSQGFEVALRSFAANCIGSYPDCPLGHGSVAAGVARVQDMINSAYQAPLTNKMANGQLANGAMMLSGVAAALYSKSFWGDLRTGLRDAFGGDGTVLLELANLLTERNPNGTYSNLADSNTAINCVDRPWPTSLSAWQTAAAQAAASAPLFGAPDVWGGLACAYWPVPGAPLPALHAKGAPPILVIGTLRDPATPYRWAQALASDLASGVLLGWNGDGHTAYGEGSACVDGIVNAYFTTLSVPRSGTVCST